MWPGQLVIWLQYVDCGHGLKNISLIEIVFLLPAHVAPAWILLVHALYMTTGPVFDTTVSKKITRVLQLSIKTPFVCTKIAKRKIDGTSENCRKTELQWCSRADNLTTQQQRVIKKKISSTIFYQTRLLIIKGKVLINKYMGRLIEIGLIKSWQSHKSHVQ